MFSPGFRGMAKTTDPAGVRTFVQLYYVVFSLDEAEALIFGGAASDGERDDRDVAGGRVAGEDAETAHRRARFHRRRRRCPVPDVNHVAHVVGRVDVTAGNVAPRTAGRPRRKHALRLGPTENVCGEK